MLRATLQNITKKIKKAIQKSKIKDRVRMRDTIINNRKSGRIKRGK